MLGILWFTVWATVVQAFYDDNTWYTAEDGDFNGMAFNWERYVRANFSDNLRTLAKAYRAEREGDDEMTMQKAKSRLRMLKVFKYTGNSYDFDAANGNMLPLSDGAKYCTMGRHTKVDCNHCTCVAGQLYMCTGMICPEQSGRPPFLSTCKEGKKRKIDSCNYCFCHNGRDFCSTKDCRLDHGHSSLRRPVCQDGHRRQTKCNRCVCYNGEEYCTRNICKESRQVLKDYIKDDKTIHTSPQNKPHHHKSNMEGHVFGTRCVKGSKRKLDSCNQCYCHNAQWYCEKKVCGTKGVVPLSLNDVELDSSCEIGTKKRLDCHRCICFPDGWRCHRKKACRVVAEPSDLLLRRRILNSRFSECIMGKVVKTDNCNLCWCGRKRRWQCTEYDCTPLVYDKSKNKEGKSCDHYDVKYMECDNRCECVAHHWLCTQKPCKKQISSGEKGAEQDGEQYMYVETCKPGDTRKLDSCNSCYCRYGQWFCQTKVCGVQKPEPTEPNENPNKNIEEMIPEANKNQDNQEVPVNILNEDVDNDGDVNKSPDTTLITDDEKNDEKPAVVETCIPGGRKRLTCYDCRCARDKTWKCRKHTNKRCRVYFANGGVLRSEPECTIGTRQRLDACNFCWCNYDQKWLCSNHTCASTSGYDYNEPSESESSGDIDFAGIFDMDLLRSNHECTLGRRQRLDACNYCWCNYDNKWLCSNHTCASLFAGNDYSELSLRSEDYVDFADILGIVGIPRCQSGTMRQADICNKCYCRGGLWFCENSPCGYSAAVKEGERRKVDACNYCVCHNGVELCTQKHCWNNQPTRSNSAEPDCISGKPLPPPDQCNVCVCLNSKILCTEINCGLRTSEDMPKCVSGMKRKADNCNSCYCRKGVWFCENKECGEPENEEALTLGNELPSQVCSPGQKSETKCHRCFCRRNKTWRCYVRKSKRHCAELEPPYLVRTGEALCVEGTQRKLDTCNYCVCYEGVEYCSQHPCWNNQQPISPYDIEPECLPGKPVPPPDQCNQCVCLYGDILCTENPCSLRSSAPVVLGSKCKRGSSKKYKCHYCACYDDGWKCRTRKKCRIDPITGKPYLRQRRVECFPGESYRVDSCNVCYCSMKNKYECQNICKGRRTYLLQIRKECRPGEKYLADSCNMCYCSTTGIVYLCARICINQRKTTRNSLRTGTNEKRCDDGSRREVDACNYCICKKGVEFCTNTACLDNQPIQPRSTGSCVEGDKYKLDDGCNYCVCQGGQEFCTARACLVKVAENTANKNTVCSDGEITSAKDNCNMCVCLQGKLTCTNRDCSEMGRNGEDASNLLSMLRNRKSRNFVSRKKTTIQICIPGEMYIEEGDDPDCPNNCICDRNEFLCTKRQCNKNRHIVYSEQLLHKKEKIRYPKQVLKQEMCEENQPLPSDDPCNTCICLNDRKVCTIIPCSEADETKMDSDEVFLGNMEKKKRGTFCDPFTFFSPDNNRFCRNCFCLHNGLALCLLNLCKYSKDIPHNISPQELNDVCTPGETGYPTKCVSCTCSDDAKWVCTREELSFCQERDCDEKDEFHMGFYPFCAGCKCAVKEWFCSIESETCQGNVTCPIGTFIHNPNQHCSICLCGGDEEGSSNMCFTEAKCVRHVISHLKD